MSRRVLRYEHRESVVMICEVDCHDEPPGRGNTREEQVTLAETDREVSARLLPTTIEEVLKGRSS